MDEGEIKCRNVQTRRVEGNGIGKRQRYHDGVTSPVAKWYQPLGGLGRMQKNEEDMTYLKIARRPRRTGLVKPTRAMGLTTAESI